MSLFEDIGSFEGFRDSIYPDHAGNPTIGVGYNLQNSDVLKAVLKQFGYSSDTLPNDFNNLVDELSDIFEKTWTESNKTSKTNEVNNKLKEYQELMSDADKLAAHDKFQFKDKDGINGIGVLASVMHMSWMRQVCGRMKSDYQYSNSIVHNNFPWPENPTEKQTQAIELAAQAVLDARAQFPDSSLADLYDPLTMPPVLPKAHQTLDKAVDVAYGKTNFKTEAERVAFLFELYQKYTSLLPAEKSKKPRKKAQGV